ncbi:transaldolase [Intrasporangium sp. DVR]|uniref:transaldolase n=1 Tax=Intrasporangium sp. DVR TaxID=3127867 RepID=UPI00313A7156
MTNPNTRALSDAGVSIWLDDLSRELLETGKIADLMEERNVVGLTSNPSIFQAALSKGDRYNEDLTALTSAGKSVEEVVHDLTTADVREACDLFRPIYDRTGGQDGRASIEVDPRLAHDTEATIAQAKQMYADVDRPNVLIKIPATLAGLPAITAVTAEGISVNVTLIFSLDRYRAVMNAYLDGLEKAHAAGKDLATIHSVASFFVSRVDTEIDKRLDAVGTDEAKALRGQAGVANARLAYQAFEEVFSTPRWRSLADEGANVQRPLWASTGVKDPAYSDTLYVTELVAPGVVNTMPGKTLEATADHGEIRGDTITGTYAEAAAVLDALAAQGISYQDVVELLEQEGVEKFEKSWGELLDGVSEEMEKVRA